MLVVLAMITINHSLGIQVKLLESEIKDLEKYKEELQKHKTLYEHIIKNKEKQVLTLNESLEKLKIENENLKTIRARLTAYSPYDNVDGQQAEGDPSKTSIGKDVGKNIVAADPKKLPYGTILEIPDWGIVEVGDTGGALRRDNKNIRLDLFHKTHKEAMDFGVKDSEVKIIRWGD